MKDNNIYVGRHKDPNALVHAKYIKKVMGKNGKWRYIYDAKELEKDVRRTKSRLKTKAEYKKAVLKAKWDYKTGKSFKNSSEHHANEAKMHKRIYESYEKSYKSGKSPGTGRPLTKEEKQQAKTFAKTHKELYEGNAAASKNMDARYRKSIAGRAEALKQRIRKRLGK